MGGFAVSQVRPEWVGGNYAGMLRPEHADHLRLSSYCGAGHNNNYCFVIPEWNMVIVRLGLDGSAGDKVWSEFLAKVGEAVRF